MESSALVCNTRALKREWTVRVDVRSRDISYTEPTEGERVVKCRCGWARAHQILAITFTRSRLTRRHSRSKDGGGRAGDGMAIKCGSRAGTNFSSDICRNSCITPSHCRALDQPGKRSIGSKCLWWGLAHCRNLTLALPIS